MSEYNTYSLSKLPKEILIKILLQKDNTEYFDLSYCYSMRDKINSRIENLKTEEVKRKLLELEEEKSFRDFILNITRMRSSKSSWLKFEYLDHKITIALDENETRVTLYGKEVLYTEITGVHVNEISSDFNILLKNFQKMICRKIGKRTLFGIIVRFLERDEIELHI